LRKKQDELGLTYAPAQKSSWAPRPPLHQ
jgi:hypothetical protein